MGMVVGTGQFHAGELAVQRRAGVLADAARLESMLGAPRLVGSAAKFLARREFAVLTARDLEGRLWTSAVTGPAGFLQVERTDLVVGAAPGTDGPLTRLQVGGDAALIAVEFGIRRRLRVNGTLVALRRDGFTLAVDQAFGNCPSYIQQRALDLEAAPAAGAGAPVAAGGELRQDQIALVRAADTFFLGTGHPQRGMDSSHKGGLPGFVRVDPDGSIRWPDYAGNNMFNSLGNLNENPEAALLFLDFATGRALHVSGRAELEWVAPGSPGDDGGTGRRIRVRPERIVESTSAVRGTPPEPSPDNPGLR